MLNMRGSHIASLVIPSSGLGGDSVMDELMDRQRHLFAISPSLKRVD